jgi:signal transduction histidine kinase
MLVLDESGRILFFNKACERMFRLPASLVVGEHVKLLMRPPAAGAFGDDLAASFRCIEALGDAGFQDGEGRRLAVEPSLSTAADAAGTRHLLILRDARHAPAGATQAVEEFTAAVVHKLNQPLTALSLYLQAIERAYSQATSGAPLPDQVVSILHKSIHEAERASSMLQELRQSFDHGDAACETQANGARAGEAPEEMPEPLDERRECGCVLAASRAIAQDGGGDLVMDRGDRERFAPQPASPARASARQEENTKWVNV